MIESWNGKPDDMEDLAEAWAKEIGAEYDLPKAVCDLRDMAKGDMSDVLVLVRDKKPVGAMGIQVIDMFFTKETYAAVRYWYILPKYRSLAKTFVNAGKNWARKHDCKKLLVCSSGLSKASDDFWKLMDFRYFETVYVGDV